MESIGEQSEVQKWADRARLAQQAWSHVASVETGAPEVSQATLARDRRAARLELAGDLSPLAAAAALESVGRCPRMAGSESSEIMARAVETFLRAGDAYALVLIAPPGRGKSWAATWAVAEFPGASVWLPAADCRVGQSWDERRGRAMKAPLLVIDDLGGEAGGEWGAREMASMMEVRYDQCRKTIVTTNLMPAEIGKRYSERLTSRWSDSRHSRLVLTVGADMRKGG